MSYDPLVIANEILAKHPEVSHMKLQKLLYFANGWWLALKDEPLLNEEPEVWRYGPVFSRLYSILSGYQHNEIGGPVIGHPFADKPERLPENSDEIKKMLSWIWLIYGGKSAMQLSDETHKIGTPWQKIASKHNFRVPFHTAIPSEKDKEYFRSLAAQLKLNTVDNNV